MTRWIVRRWARFGHERLYTETPGSTALGYLDVKTGQYHTDELANLPLLKDAIATHDGTRDPKVVPTPEPIRPEPAPSAANASAAAVPEPRPAPSPSPAPPPAAWQDLSTTRPGAAARERALAERAAQGRLRHGLARLTGAKTDERAWRIGADGEEAVARWLTKLDDRWRVLHAVPVGDRDADIDHVVIGPAGVFTVNTKYHPQASVWAGGNTFMVNGQRVPYIRNSRHEARRASRQLTEQAGFHVVATGVIAVLGAHKGITVKQQPEDGQVVVVRRWHLRKYLSRLPVRLRPSEIDAIFEVARRSTTWR